MSIMDIVNNQDNSIYYILKELPSDTRQAGRATVKLSLIHIYREKMGQLHVERGQKMKESKISIKSICLYGLLLLLSITILLPFLWMVSSSLKTSQEVFSVPMKWLPENPVWKNFQEIWTKIPLLLFFKNSFKPVSYTHLDVYKRQPLNNLIPEWNDLVYTGNWSQAYNRLKKTNSFPEFTSRVCPAPCEAACTCGLNGDPVAIKENERAIIENCRLYTSRCV